VTKVLISGTGRIADPPGQSQQQRLRSGGQQRRYTCRW
jgi:hypothetical protein